MTNSITTNFLNSSFSHNDSSNRELSEYVAHLQVHMALQSRNLVPHLSGDRHDSRSQLLQETQADFEKIVSRQ
ncbi:hypothetical protein [Synechococcus sp. PCC 7502]|uniref:hypothetical protein n=1 Tax=Synechococcus sp. PCC 7502 TaxID=1173263 RepID=UPI001FEF6E45